MSELNATPKQILAGLQARDKGMRDAFYRHHRDDLYALCCHFLGECPAAQQITKDLFEEFIRNPPEKMPGDGLMGHLRHQAAVTCIKRIARLQSEFLELGEAIKTVSLPEPKSTAGDPVGRMRRKIIKQEKANIEPSTRELMDQLDGDDGGKMLGDLARETSRPLGELLEELVPARQTLKERVETAAGSVAW